MTICTLGIDLGTSSVKALIADEHGTVVGSGAARYAVLRPEPGHAEQRPSDWWDATGRAVRDALNNATLGRGSIAAIGLSGQMHGTVLLDSRQQCIHNAIIWMDQRSAVEVRTLTQRIGRDLLIATTGSQLATGFQAATICWLQHHRPDTWATVAMVLTPKDWLRLQLTGQFASEPSDGSGTLLLDVTTRHWSQTILDALGLDRTMLPPIVPSVAVAGNLTAAAAGHLGLVPGIPVIAGAADAPAAALGAGIVEPNTMLLALSTGTQQYVPSNTPAIDPGGRIHTFCAPLESGPGSPGWYRMTATLNAGSALSWVREHLLQLPHDATDAAVFDIAAQSVPGARGLLFLPYLAGERSPLFDPQARGALIGLTGSHNAADLARAALEGITLATADAFAALRDTGAHPVQIVAVGGGAKRQDWLRLIADIYGLPVRPLAVADQSAIGAALLAMSNVNGESAFSLAARWTTPGDPIEPSRERYDFYADRLTTFKRCYGALREEFPRLSSAHADPAP